MAHSTQLFVIRYLCNLIGCLNYRISFSVAQLGDASPTKTLLISLHGQGPNG